MKLSVAVDFDGTICENLYPEIGMPRAAAKAALEWLRNAGYRIIVYSCRTRKDELGAIGYSQIAQYMDTHRLPWDSICTAWKPVAVAYFDDRAIRVSSDDDGGWEQSISEFKRLEKDLAKKVVRARG